LPIFLILTQTETPTLPIIPMALSGMTLWVIAQYPHVAQIDAQREWNPHEKYQNTPRVRIDMPTQTRA
jgi:hypothetical protein